MQSISRALQSLLCGVTLRNRPPADNASAVTHPPNNQNAPVNTGSLPPQSNPQQHTAGLAKLASPESFALGTSLADSDITHHDGVSIAPAGVAAAALTPDEIFQAFQMLNTDEARRAFVLAHPQWLAHFGVHDGTATGGASGSRSADAPVSLSVKDAIRLAHVLPYLPSDSHVRQAFKVLDRKIDNILSTFQSGKVYKEPGALAAALTCAAHALPLAKSLLSDSSAPGQQQAVRLVLRMRRVIHRDHMKPVYELPVLGKAYDWAKQDMKHREADLRRIIRSWSEPRSDAFSLKLESEIVDLPEDFHQLVPHLRGLTIQPAQFREVPDTIFELRELRRLEIKTNRLESLSEKIWNLHNLHELDLSVHRMKSLPDSLGELPELRTLNVSHGELESLPANLCNLKHLTFLNVSHNKIRAIPEGVFSGKFIVNVMADYNRISTLPSDFNQFRHDGIAHLENNAFDAEYLSQQKEASTTNKDIRWS
jgi:hypothetical protein